MSDRVYDHDAGAPASAEEIAAFEMKHGITLQADYRAFLLKNRTLYIDEDAEPIITEGELGQEWPFEVYNFVGLDADFEHFFDPKFLCIGYIVGSDPGGNPMIQLTAGQRAGQIGMIDHEVYYGCMEELLAVENGHYPDEPDETVAFKSFKDATPDQIINECEENGALAIFEMTFSEYMTQIDALYTLAHKRNKSEA